MRIKILLAVISCIVSLSMQGQIAEEVRKINVDSLQQILPGLAGKEKIDVLNRIAFAIARDHTDSSISIANRMILLSEKLDYKKGVADANMNLGISYLYLDSLKNSVNYYLNALRIYESTDTCWEMGCVLKELQGINFYTGRFVESKEYGRKAIKVFRHTSRHNYVVRTLMLLALTCTEKEEFDSSAYYNDKALSILDIYPEQNTRSSIYFDKGYNISQKNTTDIPEVELEAISWYLKALELSESLHDTDIIVLSLFNIGNSYWWVGTPEAINKGIEYTYRTKNIIEKIPIRAQLLVATYRVLAIIAYDDGNYTKAIDLFMTGIAEGRKRMSAFRVKDYPDPMNVLLNKFYYLLEIQRSFNYLANIYEELGDYKNAFKYYRLERQAMEERFRQENMNLIAMLETDSENIKINNRIAMLERDKKISELQAAQSRNLSIGIGALFMILVLTGFLFIRQNKLRNEHRNTILEQKLLRLQMNPHFIFNALSSIRSLMNPKDVNKAWEYLGNFSSLLRSSLESTREDYILLDDEVNSLRNYMEIQRLRYDQKFNYTIDVDNKIDLENAILPPMLLQPFVENAIEHGIKNKEGKGNISIRFKLENKKLNCEIEDDGIGREKAWEVKYSAKGRHRSLATEIIRDRITILNKKFRQKISLAIIDKKPGADQVTGTMVRLNLPYILD